MLSANIIGVLKEMTVKGVLVGTQHTLNVMEEEWLGACFALHWAASMHYSETIYLFEIYTVKIELISTK